MWIDTLAWDPADRITQIVSPDGTANYTHDDTDQLTVADHSVQTDENYSYDLNGNRTMTGYVTGVANRLLEDPTYTYQYDNEGNRTRRTKKSDNSYEVYEWDYRNRLTRVASYTAGGTLVEDVTEKYDLFDRRIAQIVSPGRRRLPLHGLAVQCELIAEEALIDLVPRGTELIGLRRSRRRGLERCRLCLRQFREPTRSAAIHVVRQGK